MPPTAELQKTKVREVSREFPTTFVRTAPAKDGVAATYRFSVSSEQEGMQYDWDKYCWYLETLSHEAGAADWSRAAGGSLRDRHYGEQVGSSLSGETGKDKRGWIDGVRFLSGARAQEMELGIQPQGDLPPILQNVSIRYIPLEWTTTPASKDNPIERRHVTRWTYIHTAFEPDPMDATVGPGRARPDDTLYEAAYRVLDSTHHEEERTMPPEDKPTTTPAPAPVTRSVEVLDPPPPGGAQSRSARQVADDEIRELCSAYDVPRKQEREWLKLGLETQQVRGLIADQRGTQLGTQPAAEQPQFDRGIAKHYSVRRVFAAAAELDTLRGAELEVHQELVRSRPTKMPKPDGFYIPYRMLRSQDEEISQLDVRRARARMNQRTFDGRTAGGGVEFTREGPFEFMPLLFEQSTLLMAGASVLSGLTAPVRFSRRKTGVQMQWLGTGQRIDLNDGVSEPGELTPKRVGGGCRLDKEILITSSVDNEVMVQNEMTEGAGAAIDWAGLLGPGGRSPLGVLNITGDSGIQTVDMSSAIPTWTKLTRMPAMTKRVKALSGALAYLAPPELAACMKATPRVASAAAGFLWEGPYENGDVGGYRGLASNQFDAGHGANSLLFDLVFGPWQYVVTGFFGGVEVVADRVTRKFEGEIEFAINMYADVFNRFPRAFVKAENCKAA